MRILAWTALALLVLAAAGAALFVVFYRQAKVSTVGDVEFVNELRIPAIDRGARGDDGVVRYDLEVQAGETQFLADGPATATWGVNGSFLGPTLRLRRGDTVEMNVANELPEATTLHWHGMHLPAAMDGGPHQMVEAGGSWRPTWIVDQPAATLWYHPHPHGETAEHVQRGVAGMIIVEDPEAEAELPAEYGVDDVPVIIQDRSFDGDNQFATDDKFLSNVGILGDEVLVNGTHSPYFEATTERVRLRLLNGSNARFYDLGFDDGRTFALIGTDGGLLAEPVELDRIPLSPGERAEIVVDVAPGDRAVLRSFGGLGGGSFFNDRFNGHDDRFDVLELRAAGELEPSPELPDTLAEIERLDPRSAATVREFRLSGTNINGRDMDMRRIDEVVTVGTTEIWEVRNADEQVHNFHVHDVQFQIIDVAGDAPSPEAAGWKDTVAIRAGDTVRLIMRFADYSDPDVPHMFHCHILRHEDRGMMGQFVVVEPGDVAGSPPDDHDH